MASLRKNVASQHVSFVLVNASTGAALTGATFTSKAWVAKDGAQAGFAGTFTELGNGQYDYAPTQTETNCTSFGLAINPTSSIPVNLQMFTDNWDTSQAVITSGTGTAQLEVTSGLASANAKQINAVSTSSVTTINANQGTTQPVNFTGTAGSALVKSDAVDIAGVAVSATTAQLGVNVVNIAGTASKGTAGYVGIDWAQISAPTTTVDLSGTTIKGLDTAPPTAAAIATAVWQDTTAGDFTVASSIGKSLYTSGLVPGAAGGLFIAGSNAATTVNFTGNMSGSVGSVTAITTSGGKVSGVVLVDTLTTYTGNTPQTGDNFARIGVAGVGLTNLGDVRIANLDAAVTTRMATYTQPTGFLAATFPTSVASPTNITAGTITTTTNLTNAATAGDLTATMKASVTTAATAATPTAAAVTGSVGSVVGNVGGSVASVVGAVGSVTSAVTVNGTSPLTEVYAAKNAPLTLASALYGLTQRNSQMAISGTTLTVTKRDGTTGAQTFTLDNATTPTSISQAT